MRLAYLGALLFFSAAPLAAQRKPDLKLLAVHYVAAQEAVMEKGAGPADVERLLNFYTPDFTYYHPQVGAKVTGLDNVRRGVSSHLGESADFTIGVKGILINGNMVSVSIDTSFTVGADGQKVERHGMMVLTFRDGKIVQRVDI